MFFLPPLFNIKYTCLHKLANVDSVRYLEISNPPFLRRIFVCLRFYCVGRIVDYVTGVIKSEVIYNHEAHEG